MDRYDALFRIASLGRLPDDRARERCIEALVVALATIDFEYLRANPTPSIYRSPIRYRRDAQKSPDLWDDVPTTRAARYGDCKKVVPWRLAELWLAGYSDARPMARLQLRPDGTYLFHVLIKYRGPRGVETEDPSEILGMPK